MKGICKISIAMLLWGSIGIFVKHIELSSLTIAFLRAVIATGILTISGIWLGRKDGLKIVRKNWKGLMLAGGAMGLNWVLLFQAYKYTTVANATISYYFAPIIMILLSPIVLKEKLTSAKLISAIVAMIGLFIIVNQQSKGANVTYEHLKGIGYGLGAAVLYATVVLSSKQMRELTAYEITWMQIAIAALILFPFVLSTGESIVIKSDTWIYIMLLGIVHTGIAYLLYFSGVKDISAQNIAILSYIDPISAVAFGTIFLGEALTIHQFIGAILILGANFFGEGYWKKKTKPVKV